SYLEELGSRERALVDIYSRDGVFDEREFETVVQALDLRVAVYLDSAGRLVHVWPPKPESIGTEIASRYTHLSSALRGHVAGSDAEGIPVVALAVPINNNGRRFVFSGGFATTATPITAYLVNATSLHGSRIAIVDGSQHIVAAHGVDASRTLRDQLPALATALD